MLQRPNIGKALNGDELKLREGRKGRRTGASSAFECLPPCVRSVVDVQSDPWMGESVKFPFSGDNESSGPTMVFRMAASVSFGVAAGNSRTAYLGGNYSVSDDILGVGVCTDVLLGAGAVRYVLGPVNSVGFFGIAGVIGGDVLNGSGPLVPASFAVAGTVPLTWENNQPFNFGAAGDPDIFAWRTVAFGARWSNTTEELSRGGSVMSVLPYNEEPPYLDVMAGYTRNPTFKLWETNEGAVNWVPGIDDTSYVRQNSSSGGSAVANMKGLRINFSAPAVAQVYQLEVVYHFECRGRLLAAMTTPAVSNPVAMDYLLPAWELYRNMGPGTPSDYRGLHSLSAAASDVGLAQDMHDAENVKRQPGTLAGLADKLLSSDVAELALGILGV